MEAENKSCHMQFLRAWLKSEDGRHSNPELPVSWKFDPLLERHVPQVFYGDAVLLERVSFMDALLSEYLKRNKITIEI